MVLNYSRAHHSRSGISPKSQILYLTAFLTSQLGCLIDVSELVCLTLNPWFFRKNLFHPQHIPFQLMENYPSSYSSQNTLVITLTLILPPILFDFFLFVTLHLRSISRSFWLSLQYCTSLFLNTMLSHLDYYNILLTSLPDSTLATLYSIHNIEVKGSLL